MGYWWVGRLSLSRSFSDVPGTLFSTGRKPKVRRISRESLVGYEIERCKYLSVTATLPKQKQRNYPSNFPRVVKIDVKIFTRFITLY